MSAQQPVAPFSHPGCLGYEAEGIPNDQCSGCRPENERRSSPDIGDDCLQAVGKLLGTVASPTNVARLRRADSHHL